MKSKSIYLIRHGETDYNRKGIVQGRAIDASLNEWGRAQAEAFFESYQHIPFNRIYTSSLRRTVESVQGFIDLGIPYKSYRGLDEISWGACDGSAIVNPMDESYKEVTEKWKQGLTSEKLVGGESPLEVRERQIPVIQDILSHPEENTILIAMHGRAIRILLTTLFEQPLWRMDEYPHSNLGLYKLKYSYVEKAFTLESANDITHLLALSIP